MVKLYSPLTQFLIWKISHILSVEYNISLHLKVEQTFKKALLHNLLKQDQEFYFALISFFLLVLGQIYLFFCKQFPSLKMPNQNFLI